MESDKYEPLAKRPKPENIGNRIMDQEALFYEAMSNGLVLRTLESFLSYEDLKRFRLISKQLNELILLESSFVRRTSLVLKQTRLVKKLKVIRGFGFLPRTVHFELFVASPDFIEQSKRINRMLRPLLKEVEALTFNQEEENDKVSRINAPVRTKMMVFPSIPKILSSVNCLKQLTLSGLGFKAFQAFSNEMDEKSLENLIDLTITRVTINFASPVAQLFSGCTKLQRIVFHLGAERSVVRNEASRESNPWVEVWDMMVKNKDSLRELSVNWNCFWETDHTDEQRIFPKLRSVEFCFTPDEAARVVKFLQVHSEQLVELKVHSIYEKFAEDVFNEVMHANPELKTLVIGLGYGGFSRENVEKMQLLTRFQALEDLRITIDLLPEVVEERIGIDVRAVPLDVWSVIPTSVKRLTLDCSYRQKFGHFTVEKLDFFKNMTALHLKRCVVTDTFLYGIWEKLTNLRELSLIQVRNITDVGLIGKIGCPSLANLKSLRSLEVTHSDITDRTMWLGIKLPELRYLDVSSNLNISKESVLFVLAQNPKLEYLITDRTPFLMSNRKWIMELYPKLKSYKAVGKQSAIRYLRQLDREDAENYRI